MSARTEYTEKLAEIILWVRDNCDGYRLAIAEAGIINPRPMRSGRMSARDVSKAWDGVHKPGSFHYKFLACDLDLFDPDGTYITDGDHPVWKDIAVRWESMHELATSGRAFMDSNHLSWGERDKSVPLPA